VNEPDNSNRSANHEVVAGIPQGGVGHQQQKLLIVSVRRKGDLLQQRGHSITPEQDPGSGLSEVGVRGTTLVDTILANVATKKPCHRCFALPYLRAVAVAERPAGSRCWTGCFHDLQG